MSCHRQAVPSSPGLPERVEFEERQQVGPPPPPLGSDLLAPPSPKKQQTSSSSSSSASTGGQHPHPHVHAHEWQKSPMRWVVLAEYCLLAFLNGLSWVCLSVIPKETSKRFSISEYQVDLLTACFYPAFILSAFGAVAFFDKYGVRKSLMVANVCNVISWVGKLFVAIWLHNGQGDAAFAVLLLSSCIAGTAQSFFLPVPSALSCVWFGDDERTLATTIAALSNPLGGAGGFLITNAFVSKEFNGWENFAWLFAVQLALNLVDSLLLIFVVPERPKVAPSEVSHLRLMARHEEEARQETLLERSKHIIAQAAPHVKDKNSLFIMIGTGLAAGTFWTTTTLVEQLCSPFGIDEKTIGMMGFMTAIFGLPVSVVVSRWVDANRVYKAPLLATINSITAIFGLMTLLMWAFPQGAKWIAAVLFVINGGPQNLILPLGFEALSEQTFPLDENIMATLILLSSEVLAFLLMIIFPTILHSDAMTKQNSATLVCFLLVAVNIIAFLFVFFGKVELNRKATAERAEAEDDEEAEREQEEHEKQQQQQQASQ